ncbi:ArgE/DapE family deacylase, partial [Nocardiopsis tropica]|nr:ArgE/DapE family deacylase [Nocardiopsis tropica]
MHADDARRICDAVDAAFDAQLELTAELVRHPSLRTREGSAQDLLYAEMERRGFAMDRWELDAAQLSEHVGYGPSTVSYEGVTNVVGTYRPTEHTG